MHQLFIFILLLNSTCFGHVLCPSSGVNYCTFGVGNFHASKQSQDGTSRLCLGAVIKSERNLTMPNVQYITPDDGQKGCPKYVEFYNRINLNN